MAGFLEKDEIWNRMKGYWAEKIFELLHLELGCKVYRTGIEYFCPDIYPLSKGKKNKTAREQSLNDYQRYKEHLEMSKEWMLEIGCTMKDIQPISFEDFWDKRFKQGLDPQIGSSPDFTIIMPSGVVKQFEVKFRWDGKLTSKDEMKLLRLNPPPFVFVVSKVEPFIKIFEPRLGYVKAVIKADQQEMAAWLTPDWDWRSSGKECKYYKVDRVPTDKGTFIIGGSAISSENLFYDPEILSKYEEIIKEWFKWKPKKEK